MKKALLLLVCCLSLLASKAQWVTIPDTAFANFLNNWFQFAPCMNGNQMDTTCPGIVNATSIDCYKMNIYSLEGIQYFDNLNGLRCWGNHLSTLPPLPAHLTGLVCDSNQLTSLPALPDSLRDLSCGVNLLTSLPALPKTLFNLNCQLNLLTTLPALPNNSNIFCNNNFITSVPEFPDFLLYFYASANPISCLPPIKSITYLYLDSTNITCIPNHGNVFFSSPPVDSIPICDSANTNGCPYCHAHFSIYPDSSLEASYYGFNESAGGNFTSYLWQFGDGDTSSLQFPSHTYAQIGHYTVCLTASGPDCTNTYCDSSFYVFKTEGGLMNELHIIAPTGIAELPTAAANFSLYPNPATDQLNITIDETMVGAQLNIYNTTGALVQSHQLNTQHSTLITSTLPAGIYIAEVKTKEASVKQRWVKM